MPTTVSPLRYPGGKSKFYGYVRSLLECNNLLERTYIEPFAGGAGLALKLLLNKDVSRIVINDFDPAIYAFWYCVLNQADWLCERIEDIDVNVNEWQNQKDIYNNANEHDIFTLGFATLFLNRTNVSGIVKGGIIGGHEQNGDYGIGARFNKDGLITKIRNIYAHRDDIVLTNLDAVDFLSPQNLRRYYKTFINLDPPYVKKGAQLYKNSYTQEDHENLAQLVRQCNRKWIVTYDVCPLVSQLYDNYRCSYLDVTYTVQNSRRAKEYIFFSNNMVLPNNIQLLNQEE